MFFHATINTGADTFLATGFALLLAAVSLVAILVKKNKERDSRVLMGIGAISTVGAYHWGMPVLAGVGYTLIVTGITMNLEAQIDKKPEGKKVFKWGIPLILIIGIGMIIVGAIEY
jgi:4-hydroxybenzoate polyprenyltransferase